MGKDFTQGHSVDQDNVGAAQGSDQSSASNSLYALSLILLLLLKAGIVVTMQLMRKQAQRHSMA